MTAIVPLKQRQLLRELADNNSSGCLVVLSEKVSWKIYLNLGELVYVHCSVQSLSQLKFYLHRLGCQEARNAIAQLPKSLLNKQSIRENTSGAGIYGQIMLWLISQEHLNESQIPKLIQAINQDNLFACLCVESETSSWQENEQLPDFISRQLKNFLPLKISQCLSKIEVKQRQWQDCSLKLSSIHQRPYFPPSWQAQPLPDSGSLDSKTLIQLTKVLKGSTSIRQLSMLLNKDEVLVAKILSPYIDDKIIYLNNAQAPLYKLPSIPRSPTPVLTDERDSQSYLAGDGATASTYKVVCIDDSPTILSEIERFLAPEKFITTAISDPIQAAAKIFQIEPDLILLDITMPKINGYKLCSLLRSSGKCDRVPIVMVTGNTGLIDKARAKISGANDYFTKPFTKEGLNKIVNKYLP
ncbi:MAG: response regulator [Cyanobacteria bacterium J06623_7]